MYNVFRQIEDASIVCLVKDGTALPAFMRGKWTFDGKAADPLANQSEFDRAAAESSLRIGGFYVFATAPEAAFGGIRQPEHAETAFL